jgi:hypothetical protein
MKRWLRLSIMCVKHVLLDHWYSRRDPRKSSEGMKLEQEPGIGERETGQDGILVLREGPRRIYLVVDERRKLGSRKTRAALVNRVDPC